MELLEEHRCFDGQQQRWRHHSPVLNCAMTFSIFLPPERETPPPVLYWLSGLTCNDENFTTKAGAQRIAAELGFALMEVRDELRRVTQNEMLCDWSMVWQQ